MPDNTVIDVSPVGYSEDDNLNLIDTSQVDEVISSRTADIPDLSNANVIGLTRLFECTKDEYDSQKSSSDPLFEFTLYLVNNGASLGDDANTDFYLGSRKLTDLIISDEVPSSQDYPSGKMYMVPVTTGGVITGCNVYVKIEGVVVPIHFDALSVLSYDSDSGLLEVSFTAEDTTVGSAKLICADENGVPSQDVIDAIASSISQTIEDSVISHVTLYWDDLSQNSLSS